MRARALMIAAAAALAGCTASAPPPSPASSAPTADRDPFPSSYRPPAERHVALVGDTVITATGAEIGNGTPLMGGGKIAAVGAALPDRKSIRLNSGKYSASRMTSTG